MEKPLPDSIFVFKANKKLCCLPCVESLKQSLLRHTGIAEVDAHLEKNTVTIKGNIRIVKLITMFEKISIDADLVYYKKETWEDLDQQTETCDDDEENDCFCDSDRDEVKDTGANDHVFKDQDQRKESRGKKEKECSCDDDDEAPDIGADHYKIRDTFKDHKPEKYVPPKEEFFWGDVRSGMHKKFPMMPGPGSRFLAGFPNSHAFYYPAPWPQEDYM